MLPRIRALASLMAAAIAACGDVASTSSIEPPACTGNLVDLSSDVHPIHDPAIAREKGTYYVYSSSPTGTYYASSDLRTWTRRGSVFDGIPPWILDLIPQANHIGSPDIEWFDGRWVLYYQSHIQGTCNAAIGVATNRTLDPASPDYEWKDHGLVLRSTPEFANFPYLCGQDGVWFDAIDPTLFVDPADGRPWLAFGSTLGGIYLVEVDPGTLRPTQQPRDFVLLAARDLGLPDPIIEAPYLVRRGGWYYLFLSHDRCCQGANTTYKILVGRSRRLGGPYLDHEGRALLDGGGTVLIEREGSLIGTGHADVFSDGGYDYLVHHAYDATSGYEPVLNVRRLVWDDEGWPSACQLGG